jgi:hypothetical protein
MTWIRAGSNFGRESVEKWRFSGLLLIFQQLTAPAPRLGCGKDATGSRRVGEKTWINGYSGDQRS